MKRQRTEPHLQQHSPTSTLLQHLQSTGASFPNLTFQQTPNAGITARATKALAIGEVVFTLPHSSILTTTKVQESHLGQVLQSTQPASSTEFQLCLYLILALRDTTNPFHCYAASLSSTPPDPTHWPVHLQSRVRGTVATAINKALQELNTWFVFCHNKTQNPLSTIPSFNRDKPTMKELKWARGHMVSRRFAEQLIVAADHTTAGTTGTHNYSMLPGLDLLNHSDQVEMKWDMDKEGTVRFITMTPVAKGDICWNNYGQKSNTSLLFMHGFALNNNPCDNVELSLKSQHDGVVNIEWQDCFYGNETCVPNELLFNFIEEDEELCREAIEYIVSWLNSYLSPLLVFEKEEEDLLLGGNEQEQHDERLVWIAHHHSSQRRILRHIEMLLNNQFEAVKESRKRST